jgi:hypothetical protein
VTPDSCDQHFEKYEKRYDRLGGGSPLRIQITDGIRKFYIQKIAGPVIQIFEKYEKRYDRLGGGSPLRMRKIMKSMNRGTTASAAAHHSFS